MRHSVDGDDALGVWVSNWYATAFRTASLILQNRSDAEEAVQEAFLRAWRFRDAMPTGDAARSWLYRVVVNTCLSKLRRRRETVAIFPEAPDDRPLLSDGDVESLVLVNERVELVVAALARLPDHLRVVTVLRYYAGLSEAEIATAIRRRPGTVKSRLHEARRRLGNDKELAMLAQDREAT